MIFQQQMKRKQKTRRPNIKNDTNNCVEWKYRSLTIKMQFIKQPTEILIQNCDIKIEPNKSNDFRRHGVFLPNSIRCILCGPSNCGKTNMIIGLLEDPNGLRFKNVYLYSMSLHQPKYVYLKNMFNQIDEIGFYRFSSNEEVIPPENAKPNSIFIFDDVITQKQNNIKSYFCMGRHNNIDCFYLTQSYAHVPKHSIRENANFIFLFKQDENIKHIYSDFGLSSDLSFEKFKMMCMQCWEK